MWETLKAGQAEREKTEELLAKQIQEEFKAIEDEMLEERKLREEQEESMLEMLRDVI